MANETQRPPAPAGRLGGGSGADLRTMSGSRRDRPAGPADRPDAWGELERRVVECRECPRLVEHRERTARDKRAAFADEEYWGRPVPGFGDRRARLLIVGLAPAAHGANRTGRMFTGDRSGDWLYRALHETGFANQAESTDRGDGLELDDAFISAVARCAPPDNMMTPEERRNCRPYLEREVDLLDSPAGRLAAVVALGGYAFDHVLRVFRDRDWDVPSPKPDFGHDVEVLLGRPVVRDGPGGSLPLIASYHPSQQNTFTGRLTREMLRAVFERARRHLDDSPSDPSGREA